MTEKFGIGSIVHGLYEKTGESIDFLLLNGSFGRRRVAADGSGRRSGSSGVSRRSAASVRRVRRSVVRRRTR